MANTSLGDWCHFSLTGLFVQCDWVPNTAKVRRGLISPLAYPHKLVWKKNQLIFTLVMPFPQIIIIVFSPICAHTNHLTKPSMFREKNNSLEELLSTSLVFANFAERRDVVLVPLPFFIPGTFVCLCLPPHGKTPNESLQILSHSPHSNNSHVLLQSQP